jgi:hypothetical protein
MRTRGLPGCSSAAPVLAEGEQRGRCPSLNGPRRESTGDSREGSNDGSKRDIRVAIRGLAGTGVVSDEVIGPSSSVNVYLEVIATAAGRAYGAVSLKLVMPTDEMTVAVSAG